MNIIDVTCTKFVWKIPGLKKIRLHNSFGVNDFYNRTNFVTNMFTKKTELRWKIAKVWVDSQLLRLAKMLPKFVKLLLEEFTVYVETLYRSCWDILTNVFNMSRVVTKFVSRVLTETKYSGNLKAGSNRSKKRPRFLE